MIPRTLHQTDRSQRGSGKQFIAANTSPFTKQNRRRAVGLNWREREFKHYDLRGPPMTFGSYAKRGKELLRRFDPSVTASDDKPRLSSLYNKQPTVGVAILLAATSFKHQLHTSRRIHIPTAMAGQFAKCNEHSFHPNTVQYQVSDSTATEPLN